MRILFIAKYPPIQGGVATQAYWSTVELVRLGHEVHVVSNRCVESNFAVALPGEELPPPAAVHVLRAASVAVHSVVPWAQPFSSALLGAAYEVCQLARFDLVVGWYFEPYGVVASIIGQHIGVPVLLIHAGSDLGRLAQHPNLQHTYRHMIGAARWIATSRIPEIQGRLNALGATADQLREYLPLPTPDVYYRAEPAEDLTFHLQRGRQWLSSLQISARLREQVSGRLTKTIDVSAQPIFMAYGKVGETKGTYDLLRALSSLAERGRHFVLLVIALGTPESLERYFATILRDALLSERVRILAPVPPWRIPELLKVAALAFSLERLFDVSFHGPSIAREILASGACLVCSDEIACKQWFASSLIHRKTCIRVADPRDAVALADAIDDVVYRTGEYRSIGSQGRSLVRVVEATMPEGYSLPELIGSLADESRGPHGETGT